MSSPCPDSPHLGDDAPGHAEDGREAPVPGLALDDVVAVVAVAGEAERRVQQLRGELLAVVVQQRAVHAVTWTPGVTLATVEIQTKVRGNFAITEKAPTMAFSLFNAPTSALTFKIILRHYAKQVVWLV